MPLMMVLTLTFPLNTNPLYISKGGRKIFLPLFYTLFIFGTAFFNGFYLYIAVVFSYPLLCQLLHGADQGNGVERQRHVLHE